MKLFTVTAFALGSLVMTASTTLEAACVKSVRLGASAQGITASEGVVTDRSHRQFLSFGQHGSVLTHTPDGSPTFLFD